MNRLAIVVLNWNSADDTMRCIDSLLAQTPDVPDIILVDNHSGDDSIDRLERYITRSNKAYIQFIKNDVNSGYSGGNNVGFSYAISKGYSYIGTLNPDATADKHWAKELLAVFNSKSEVGIATGLMLNPINNTIDTSGEVYSSWGIPGPRLRGAPAKDAPSEPEYVFASTGGGFISHATLFQKVGMFDEKFFMYYEDVDFCFRSQLAGYKVYYTPKAIAYHKISASTNKVPGLALRQTFKNLPMLFVKNVPFSLWFNILPRFTLTYILILGNAIAHGNGAPAFVGWWKSLGLIPHMWRERQRIQSTRKVSDAYINSIILHDIPPEQTGMRKFRRFFTGK